MAAKDTVELLHSVFELLKSMTLVFVFVALFAFPSLVQHALEGIGVAEFDLWGFKGKTALAKVAVDLQEAQVVQKELSQKLAASDTELKRLIAENDELRRRPNARVSGVPLADGAVHALLARNDEALKRANFFQTQAEKALEQNATIISLAKQQASRGDQRWIVIFGSDTSEAAALLEIERAIDAGFDSAYVCLKGGRYRSVVEFPSLDLANSTLSKIRSLSPTAREAYVVNLGSWCPRLEKRNAKLFECA